MKKKLLSLILVASMAASMLVGCGGKDTTETVNDAPATDVAATDDSAPAGNDGAASGDLQVGIVLPTKDEPRWLQDQAQFESILGDAGFTNQVLFSQGSSATEKTNV